MRASGAGRAAALLAGALLLAALALAARGTTSAAAQEGPGAALDVRVTVEPTTVRLGERVRLTIIATHDETLLITAQGPQRTAALFIVEALPEVHIPPAPGETRATTEFGFTLAVFELGVIAPGAVRVAWLRDDGRSGELTVAAPSFEVQRTITATTPLDTQLRPLKPQLSLAGGAPAWRRWELGAAALAAVAALALVAAAALRRARRVRRARSAPAGAGALAAANAAIEGEARRRLQAIEVEAADGGGDLELFYGGISVTVREYLQRRFEFPAAAMTTTELGERMAARGVERWQARLVSGLLDRCDAAVYAGRHPDPASADHDLTVAFEIIELSRPRSANGAAAVPGDEGRGRDEEEDRP